MVFSSHIFLFYFLPLVLLLNYVLPFRWLTLMLAGLSYVFYGWTNPKWLGLLFLSSFVDYWCGLALVKFSGLPVMGPTCRGFPRTSLAIALKSWRWRFRWPPGLAILGFFKYFDFGVSNINAVAAALGMGEAEIRMLHVALPIGISFYTFQSMSYAIDVYRGEARPMRSPIDFACFVALFPHQLAGPIIRYWSIAEQFRRRSFTMVKLRGGGSDFSRWA